MAFLSSSKPFSPCCTPGKLPAAAPESVQVSDLPGADVPCPGRHIQVSPQQERSLAMKFIDTFTAQHVGQQENQPGLGSLWWAVSCHLLLRVVPASSCCSSHLEVHQLLLSGTQSITELVAQLSSNCSGSTAHGFRRNDSSEDAVK